MLNGERLYADMVDLNPPFIFWLSMPAALAGGGDASVAVFRIMLLASLAAILIVAWPLARRVPSVRIGYVLMAIALTIGFFGEREHLLFALVVPYVALAIARAEGRTGGGVVPGILAGVGMALKPPAILLAVAIALDGWRRERSARALFRPEHLAAAAVLAAALLAIGVLAPSYLDVVARYGAPYAEFSRGSLGQLLFRHWYAIAGLSALAIASVLGRTVPQPARVTLLGIATAALLAAAVAQGKGFGYHYFPAMGFAVMLLLELVLAPAAGTRWTTPVRRIVAGAALAIFISLPVHFTLLRVRGESGGNVAERTALSAALGDLPARTGVAILSIRLGDAYPLIVERQWQNVLPVPHLWFVDASDTPAVRELWRRVAAAIDSVGPAVVIVRAPTEAERGPGDEDVNYLRLLCRDAAGVAALDGYRHGAHAGGFDIYRRGGGGERACGPS